MDARRGAGQMYLIWVNEKKRIVSLRFVEGFRRVRFKTQEEKIAFAVEKFTAGYLLQ